MLIIALIVLLGTAASPRLALLQQSADKFEVASIRPSPPPPGRGGGGGRFEYPPALCASVGSVQITPGRFITRRTNLTGLIAAAYGNRCPLGDMLSGGPDWVRMEEFEIQALIPPGSPVYTNSDFLEGKAPQLQKMLQNLLAERFQLRLRREMKEMPAYNMVLVQEGKLKLSADQTGATRVPMPRGSYTGGNSTSMAEFAGFLQWSMNRLVLDKTGLKGLYEAVFALPPLSFQSNGAAGVRDVQRQTQEDMRDRVPRAIEEQLGLRLEPVKVQVEFLTIEHAERPTHN
jgi:uncharacterized protein (TIGR03435 family)